MLKLGPFLAWSIQQILRLRGVPLATGISGCRQTGFSTLSTHHGQDAHTACITSGPPAPNRYIYFNSKPGGIAANCVTVCELHGKTIN
jgi:hypothetical protein